MIRSITNGSKTIVASVGIAAGVANVPLPVIDTLGYTSVRIVALLGALTATQQTSLAVQQSLDNGATDPFVLAPGATTPNAADADSNKLLILDVFKPHKRYLLPILNRATANAAVTSVIYELYNAQSEPVASDVTVSQQLIVANPH